VNQLPTILALAAYGYVALAHLLPDLANQMGGQKTARYAGMFGVACHAVALVALPYKGVVQPGFSEALSAASFGIMFAYLLVGRERLRALGLLLAPLSVVILGTATVVPRQEVVGAAALAPALSPWLPVHLGLMVAGLGGFALAFAVGVVYLYVRDRLKKKQLASIRRLPSLEALDRVQFRAMLFGFTFLTLGIGVGGALAAASLEGSWSLDPKVWFVTLIWAWYAVALQIRLVAGWRGRLSALFSIVGFGGMIFSLLVMNFLVGGFHAHVS